MNSSIRHNLFLLRECRNWRSWATMKGYLRPERTQVFLRSARAPILCRGRTSDVAVIWELFFGQEYRGTQGWPYRTVLDLGANCGVFAAYAWAQSNGALQRYVGVEPDPESFSMLQQQVERQGMTGISYLLNCAAADRDGITRFDNQGQSYGRRLDDQGAIEVSVRTINSILDAAGLPAVDLIKMDIEGGEAALLPSVDQWSRRARTLVVELHNGLDLDWLTNCLGPAGFEVLPAGALFRGQPGARRVDGAVDGPPGLQPVTR